MTALTLTRTFPRAAALCCALLPLLLAGCGERFSIETPPDFVERREPGWTSYAYRALNADAVVLGVREIDEDARDEGGLFEERKDVSLAFWLQAIKNRLQASHAYALLGEEALEVASGQQARLLRFGREDAGVQHSYWVGLVDAGRYLYVLEAGGREEAFGSVREAIAASFRGFRAE